MDRDNFGWQVEPPRPTRRVTVRRLALGLTLLLAAVIALAAAALAAYILWFPLPTPKLPLATEVYDSNGELITRLYAQNRSPAKLEDLPPYVPLAVLAVEDARFFEHRGIDPVAIARAAFRDVSEGQIVQGGSTITQQLVKNLYLSADRTFSRKVVEAVMALKLEHRYDKRELLEMYLNAIYLGHGTWGFEAASQYYFGTSARDLSLAQAALLAGLIRSPETHSPHNNPELARQWQQIVLDRMLELNWASVQDVQAALEEKLVYVDPETRGNEAPYFVNYVAQVLERRHPQWKDRLHLMGLRIYTTLDSQLQRAANDAVAAHIAPLQDHDSRGVPQPQAAVAVLDPADGSVRALVGGTDYRTTPLNRAVAQPGRQPGSAFKPILYAAVLDAGYTALSMQPCERVSYQDGQQTYTPTDFGTQPYHNRQLTVRESLVLSDNVTTVRWTRQVGPATVVQYARRFGIQSPLSPTLSIALGSYEVTPLELARAYAVLANGGWRVEPRVIERVETADGVVVDSGEAKQREPVLSADIAFILTDMLRDVLDWGTGHSIGQVVSRPAAAKTGTSQNQYDAWFAGYTHGAVVVVWVGEDQPRALPGVGSTLAGPVWADVVNQGLKGRPTVEFARPAQVRSVSVCRASGLLPGTYPDVFEEWFVKGTEPANPCPQPANPLRTWWQQLWDALQQLKNGGKKP